VSADAFSERNVPIDWACRGGRVLAEDLNTCPAPESLQYQQTKIPGTDKDQPMSRTVASTPDGRWTMADVMHRLGSVSPERICAVPPPGTATEEDVLAHEARTDRPCELIDGTLVEKTMGYYGSLVAGLLIRLLGDFVESRGLGIVLGEAGTLRILPGQVRIPDVCFIAWDRFPDRRLPREPIPAVAPDLAIEILSEGNTVGEMRRKLRDYFEAGVRLVWYIDPATRTAEAYSAPDQCLALAEQDVLDGGDVLPGFCVSLQELFLRAEGQPPNRSASAEK